jgi:trk system potassium uptake protein TrkA
LNTPLSKGRQTLKVVILGAGEVGFHIARRLAIENRDVVLVDNDADALRRVSDNIDVKVIHGSGSSPATLKEAGVEGAETILAVTNFDETNLVACLVADILSPSIKKIARLRNTDFDDYHDIFSKVPPHINTVVNPEIEMVKAIDQLITIPTATEMNQFADGQVKFVGIKLDKNARVVGVHLSGLSARVGNRVPLIAAILRNDKLIIPRGDDRLLAGDDVYFITEEHRLFDSLAVFDKQFEPVRRVIIVGGGLTGLRLAALLDGKSIHTKIIEKNPEQCKKLAEQLSKTIVIHGDGSDQDLLKEENIQNMDIVVTLTNDEESNIIISLLAKRMGAKKAITKVNRFSYIPLMGRVGIEKVVSPRLSAINSIMRHIRRGKVLSLIAFKEEQAEIIEAVPIDNSAIVFKPLKDIALPKGVLVTGIIRGECVMIPSGESVINPRDRIIIFAQKKAIPKLDKILAIKMDYFNTSATGL